MPISCHLQACKAPLSSIVSGAISSELPLPFLPLYQKLLKSVDFHRVNRKKMKMGPFCNASVVINRRARNECLCMYVCMYRLDNAIARLKIRIDL